MAKTDPFAAPREHGIRSLMTERLPPPLDQSDLTAIVAHDLTAMEIERQISLLTGEITYREVDRPATVGDGIRRLNNDEVEQCRTDFRTNASRGRYLSFVPASGAASRMFKTLLGSLESGRALDRASLQSSTHDADADVLQLFTQIDRFAIATALASAMPKDGPSMRKLLEGGDYGPLLHALMDDSVLGLPAAPKGLLPFHLCADTTRTAFEEHLHEAAALLADADGCVRLHLTVSAQHQTGFQETLENVRKAIEDKHQITLDVDFSTQSPATNTIALDAEGQLFRTREGALLFRPGGHGSLIRNLNDLDGDLVFIKNIDNIVPDDRRDLIVEWREVLGGLLAHLQNETLLWLDRLAADPRDAAVRRGAAHFIHTDLGLDTHEDEAKVLTDVRDRPMRVCGVVANTGDPGGGPFWVRAPDGSLSRQIVETAEIDPDNSQQTGLLAAATHFNPTDMVCALRTADGRPLPLADFVDPDAVFVAHKSNEGRDLRALEHPGLWNGSMAHWTTIFIEVPRETFQPVKSFLDLLGAGHAPLPAAP